MMLWIKFLHIVAIISWFAGLFYLPRLFVYHSLNPEVAPLFKVMERKLYWIIMTPAALVAIASGLLLWYLQGILGGWIHAKLLLVIFLVIYHFFCFRWLKELDEDRGTHTARFFRIVNEIPTLLLLFIIYLVVFKPF
jgi:putative membrane protein